jgi:hypothetical protein
MGKTKYEKCREVLRRLLKEFGDEIGLIRLQNAIRKYIGADEKRTVLPSTRLMLNFGLIKDINNCHFRINTKEVLD